MRDSFYIKELKGRHSSYPDFDITGLNRVPEIPTLINIEAKVPADKSFSHLSWTLLWGRVSNIELMIREQRQVTRTANKILARR